MSVNIRKHTITNKWIKKQVYTQMECYSAITVKTIQFSILFKTVRYNAKCSQLEGVGQGLE